ncbi:uncharacterized protein LOC135471874 [Liolophura sinensis]|uniref:uncharacterized protein LOC135471874 n=1 Tax=Liolophura sinensis TaxID=3198878 RepID=UPI003158DB3D
MKGLPDLLPPFFLLVLCHKSTGKCPNNALNEAMKCIGRIGDFGMSTNVEEVKPWDYQRTKIACENGAFTLAMNCAENIVDTCTERELGVALDIPMMRNAVQDMCSQVDAMRPYVDCMHDQLDVVTRCAERQKKLFHAKVRTAGDDSTKRMQSVCSFTNNVYGCQTNLVRKNCGEVPAKFLLNIMNAFRWPSCPPPDGVNSASPRRRASTECKILWTFSFVIFAFQWIPRTS